MKKEPCNEQRRGMGDISVRCMRPKGHEGDHESMVEGRPYRWQDDDWMRIIMSRRN